MKNKIYEMLRMHVAKRATHNLGDVVITDDEVICYVDGKELKKQSSKRYLHRYNIMLHCIKRDEEIYKTYRLDKPVHYIIKNVDFDKEINIQTSTKDCHVTFENCKFTAGVSIDFADHLTFFDNTYRMQTYDNYLSYIKYGEFIISTRANKNEINKIEFILDKIKFEDEEVPVAIHVKDLNKPRPKKMINAVPEIWLYAKEISFYMSDICNAKNIEIGANNLEAVRMFIGARELEIKADNINFDYPVLHSDVITIDSSKIEGTFRVGHNGLFINGVEIDKNKKVINVDNYDMPLQQKRLELINSLKKIERTCEKQMSEEIKKQPLTRVLKK